MARIPMVTRTMNATKVTVLCMDIVSAEPCTKVVTVPRTYKEDKALLKKVRALCETDEFKVVHIVDKEVSETLYGMTEDRFIECAEVLPSRKSVN